MICILSARRGRELIETTWKWKGCQESKYSPDELETFTVPSLNQLMYFNCGYALPIGELMQNMINKCWIRLDSVHCNCSWWKYATIPKIAFPRIAPFTSFMYVPKTCNETHQQKRALSRMDESCLFKENRKKNASCLLTNYSIRHCKFFCGEGYFVRDFESRLRRHNAGAA